MDLTLNEIMRLTKILMDNGVTKTDAWISSHNKSECLEVLNSLDITALNNKLKQAGVTNTEAWLRKHRDVLDRIHFMRCNKILLIEDTATGYEFLTYIMQLYDNGIYIFNPADLMNGATGGIESVYNVLSNIKEFNIPIVVMIDEDSTISNDSNLYTRRLLRKLCDRKNNLSMQHGYICFEAIPFSCEDFKDLVIYMSHNVSSEILDKIDKFYMYFSNKIEYKDIPDKWKTTIKIKHTMLSVTEIEVTLTAEEVCAAILHDIPWLTGHKFTKVDLGYLWKEDCIQVKCSGCGLKDKPIGDKLDYIFRNSFCMTMGGIFDVKNFRILSSQSYKE